MPLFTLFHINIKKILNENLICNNYRDLQISLWLGKSLCNLEDVIKEGTYFFVSLIES